MIFGLFACGIIYLVLPLFGLWAVIRVIRHAWYN